MKVKINWGTGIAIAIGVMIIGVLSLVYIATRQHYYLVEKDYYQKSINFQQQIDKRGNADRMQEKVVLKQLGNHIQLDFPKTFQNEQLKGTIHLYSPLSEKNDLNLPLDLDTKLCQQIPVTNLPKGRYIVKLDWISNEIPYYQQLEIIIE